MFELTLVLGAIVGAVCSGKAYLAPILLAVFCRELSTAGPGQLWIDVACDPSRATEVLDVQLHAEI